MLWQARQGPWENGVFSGPGSGVFKSTVPVRTIGLGNGKFESEFHTVADRESKTAYTFTELAKGTTVTRAAIIEVLLKREYMVRGGKNLEATEKGIQLIEVVHPDLARRFSDLGAFRLRHSCRTRAPSCAQDSRPRPSGAAALALQSVIL